MSYTSKDLEFLGRQVVGGKYVARSTFLLSIVLALVLGGMVGRFTAPDSMGFISGEEQRPVGAQGPSITSSQSQQVLASILQHEEEGLKNPGNAENWEHLGNLYYDADQPEKAISAYEKNLALKPDNTSVLVDCGVMYREIKNFSKALEFFRKARAINPKHEVAHFNEGIVLYHDLDRKEDGMAIWKKLVEMNPQAKTPSGTLVQDMIKELGAR